MNDYINTPRDVFEALKSLKSSTIIMKPKDKFNFVNKWQNNKLAISYWDKQIRKKEIIKNNHNIQLFDLEKSFKIYRIRILSSNNMFLIKIIYYFSPIKFFRPVNILLTDLGETVEIDYVKNKFSSTTKSAMLKMNSQSLDFIFKNQFGFDTLNVNARFEEGIKYGWSKAVKTLSIETLNNMGFKVNFSLIFNTAIINTFIRTILKVLKNIKK